MPGSSMSSGAYYYGDKRRCNVGPQDVFLVGEDGQRRSLEQKIVWHSPDGFQWGYGGSGPADLALNMLLDVTGDEDFARSHHQAFKWAFIAGLDDEFRLPLADIEAWIAAQKVRGIV